MFFPSQNPFANSLAFSMSLLWVDLSPPQSRMMISLPVSFFRDSFANRRYIAGISNGKTLNPHVYSPLCPKIPKL
jgi:hypothetical protein